MFNRPNSNNAITTSRFSEVSVLLSQISLLLILVLFIFPVNASANDGATASSSKASMRISVVKTEAIQARPLFDLITSIEAEQPADNPQTLCFDTSANSVPFKVKVQLENKPVEVNDEVAGYSDLQHLSGSGFPSNAGNGHHNACGNPDFLHVPLAPQLSRHIVSEGVSDNLAVLLRISAE